MMIDRLGGRASLPPLPASTPSEPAAAPVNRPRTARASLTPFVADVRDMAIAPPVDGAKVERVRAAIASGTYPIDPAKIADRMVALDLPARG